MENTIIGLKKLRENTDAYISLVRKGKSFIVVKRSRPVFKIVPPSDAGELWETVLDFTDFYKKGIPAKQLLRKIRALHGKTR